MPDLDSLDGLIGEAWSGEVPNGSHINVVLARRGSPTAASATGAFAHPAPGHAPVAVCMRAGEVVRPATIMLNKATCVPGTLHERITWGAGQLGIAQGVLDAVAAGTVEAAWGRDLVLLVAIWVDPEADDETAVRRATRDATGRAIADAIDGGGVEQVQARTAARETAANAFYRGA